MSEKAEQEYVTVTRKGLEKLELLLSRLHERLLAQIRQDNRSEE